MKLGEIFNIDSRKSFAETWLKEMQTGLGQFETLDVLIYSIRDFLGFGIIPRLIKGDLYVIDIGTTMLYWIGSPDGKEVRIAVELKKESEALVVTILGKDRNLKGQAPFASDLYSDILTDSSENLRIKSDKFLSDEGFSVWKSLVKRGHKISVYDADNPSASFKTFDSADELDSFFAKGDTAFSRYQFVLSEGLIPLLKVRSSFNLRKYRESVPGLL
jgi:hypothetical protein